MHVLFDARLLHRSLSGLERVQRNLLRELVRRPEITRLRALVTAGAGLPEELPAGVEPAPVHSSEEILRILLADDPRQRPDVYHLSWFPDRTPRDLWLPLAARASVVEVHDAILNRHPEYYPDRQSWQWYDAFVRALLRSCDRLLCHSRSVLGEIERDLGGEPGLADVVALAVDPALRQPLPEAEVRARLQRLGIEGQYFVAVGKDYPHKDHVTLFRALSALGGGARVVCAGSQVWGGPGSSREVVAQLGLEGAVRWIEGLGDQEVKALLQGSKGLVYPSREEGFGLPPIEAMALGVPVLAAAAMAIPEVCGDGAWLFAPGDHAALAKLMQRALAAGPDVAALVARGRARELTFSWARTAEGTLRCYRNAVEAAGEEPRRRPVLTRATEAVLRVIASSPHDAGRELLTWQQRCQQAEQRCQQAEQRLAALAQAAAPPPPAPVEPRPRWSLRRRWGKIRDGWRAWRAARKAAGTSAAGK